MAVRVVAAWGFCRLRTSDSDRHAAAPSACCDGLFLGTLSSASRKRRARSPSLASTTEPSPRFESHWAIERDRPLSSRLIPFRSGSFDPETPRSEIGSVRGQNLRRPGGAVCVQAPGSFLERSYHPVPSSLRRWSRTGPAATDGEIPVNFGSPHPSAPPDASSNGCPRRCRARDAHGLSTPEPRYWLPGLREVVRILLREALGSLEILSGRRTAWPVDREQVRDRLRRWGGSSPTARGGLPEGERARHRQARLRPDDGRDAHQDSGDQPVAV